MKGGYVQKELEKIQLLLERPIKAEQEKKIALGYVQLSTVRKKEPITIIFNRGNLI